MSEQAPIVLDAAAILFDNDGVLSDSLQAVDAAWHRWAVDHHLDPAEVLAYVHGRPARESIARFAPDIDQDVAFADLERLELASAADTREVPGAQRLTAHLPADRWIVVTSGTELLATARLATIDIVPPAMITADDVTHGKPNPEPYVVAATTLGVDVHDCVVFEDTGPGIAAARTAGATVIGITGTNGAPVGADHYVRDLTDVTVAVRVDGSLRLRLLASTEY